MDILKKLSLWLCVPLLASCYTDFEPALDSTPVLCMNAIIDAGHEFTVQLSHSWRYDDYDAYKSDHNVTDGTVEVFADGIKVCEAVFSEWEETDSDGVQWHRSGYRIPYAPEAGREISLRAYSAIYGNAEATVVVPSEPLTGSVQVDSTVMVNNYMFDDCVFQNFHISMNVSLPVVDRSGVAEYYQLAWETVGGDDCEFNSGNPEYDMEPIFSEHVDALETVFASDAWGFTVFSDNSFRGGSYPLRLMFKNMRLYRVIGDAIMTEARSPQPDNTLPQGCMLRLILFSLDRNLYNWYLYDWYNCESFIGTLGYIGLAESPTAYSNVSTRAGLVVARNRIIIDIPI